MGWHPSPGHSQDSSPEGEQPESQQGPQPGQGGGAGGRGPSSSAANLASADKSLNPWGRPASQAFVPASASKMGRKEPEEGTTGFGPEPEHSGRAGRPTGRCQQGLLGTIQQHRGSMKWPLGWPGGLWGGGEEGTRIDIGQTGLGLRWPGAEVAQGISLKLIYSGGAWGGSVG